MSEFVSIHVDAERPGVGTLVLSRPPTNAMTRQVYREIGQAAAEVARRDDIAAVIVFGGHEIFSAGDDTPQLRTLAVSEAETWARVRHDAVDAVAATRWAPAWAWPWPPIGGSVATTCGSVRRRFWPVWCLMASVWRG
jgi:enoyl-CoA hydratase/carnithine racemase